MEMYMMQIIKWKMIINRKWRRKSAIYFLKVWLNMVQIILTINSIEDLKKLEMYDIIFIDSIGNAIANEDIKSHDKFNDEFAENNPELVERYKTSNYNNMTLFLICEEGYMQAGKIGDYKGLMYNSAKATNTQKTIKELFEKMGYDVEDLAPEKDLDQR